MTAKELIQKVKEIASRYFNVVSVDFSLNMNFSDNKESMNITCFYELDQETYNFSSYVFSGTGNYSVERMIQQFENDVANKHRKKFPQAYNESFDLFLE